jgi:hypothetical protein
VALLALALQSSRSPPPRSPTPARAGCFAVGTDQGFRIYNCEPFKETFRRDFTAGGIGMVEMLFRCNILALVGGGRTPRYPPHKVMIWDDHQNRCIGELSFRAEVKAVRLRRDRVVVALERRVYIYNFADLTLVDHVETADNPRGLCAVSPSPTHNVLACPGVQKGHVRVELYDQRKTTLIAAHEAALACLALNGAGTRLATASEKGTLIRVYDTATGDLLQELRRGADKADIHCLAFNVGSSMLACTSEKGTCHMFRLKESVWESATAATGSAAAAGGTTAAGATAGAAGSASSPAPVSAASPSAPAPSASSVSATSASAQGVPGSSTSSSSSASSSSSPAPSTAPSAAAASAAAAAQGGVGASSSGSSGGAGVGSGGAGARGPGGVAASPGGSAGGAGGSSGTGAGGTTGGAPGGPTGAPAGDGDGVFMSGPGSAAGGVAGGASSAGGGGGGGSGGGGGGFSLIKNILPKYFSSEWSFAQFRVPEGKSICAFGTEPNTIIVIAADGSFFKANFERGGEAVRVAYAQFVKAGPAGASLGLGLGAGLGTPGGAGGHDEYGGNGMLE